MRLHRLELTNVKAVRHRRVVFPDSAIIVVEGANEVGKTSLIEALDLVLDFKDTSRDKRVQAIRPVGRDVPSAIEVEMSTGCYRFTYRKQWFRQSATTLSVHQPRQEHLVGSQAHERVQQILAETADLTLWKALRLMQASSLGPADLSGSVALTAALDSAAGRCGDSGAEGQSLVAAAQSAFITYYTARSGTRTGQYREAAERLRAAREAYQRAQAAVAEVEADAARHDQVCAERRELEAELVLARQEAEQAAEQWDQVSRLTDAAAVAGQARAAASRALQAARERLTERSDAVARLEALEQQTTAAAQEADRVAEMVGPAQAELAQLTEQRCAAQAALDCLEEQAGRATALAERHRVIADLAALRARIAGLAQLSTAAARAAEVVSGLPVDGALLARVERAHQALEAARATQAAGSARVRVTGLGAPVALTVDGTQAQLTSGEQVERTVTGEFTVVLPGLLSVNVSPGQGTADLAAAVEAAEQSLTRVLNLAGLPDIESVRQAHAQRLDAVTVSERAERAVAEFLGKDTAAELTARFTALQRAACSVQDGPGHPQPVGAGTSSDDADLNSVATAEPVDGAAGPGALEDADGEVDPAVAASAAGAAAAEADRLVAEVKAAAVRLAELAGAGTDLAGAVQSGLVHLATAQARRDALAERLDADLRHLAGLRDSSPDHQLADLVDQADRERARTELAEQAIREQLSQLDPDRARLRMVAAQAAITDVEARRATTHDEQVAIEARLELARSQGRKDTLDLASAELTQADRELLAIERRAEAARLLHETLQQCQATAKRAYVAPFRDAVNRLGRVVFGPSFDVEVADDLTIAARILDGTRISYQQLSTGAKEQLAIMTRLACAGLVDPQAGAPVVIDDALGYTDPQRLGLMAEAIGMVGPQAQVILLTCTPGRYAAIPGAQTLRLEPANRPGAEAEEGGPGLAGSAQAGSGQAGPAQAGSGQAGPAQTVPGQAGRGHRLAG